MTRTSLRALCTSLALSLCACATERPAIVGIDAGQSSTEVGERAVTSAAVTRSGEPASPEPDTELPGDWDTMDLSAFARLLAPWKQDTDIRHLNDGALAVLSRALAKGAAASVRAAVILANTRDPRAGEILLARLEARVPEEGRGLAGDIVAAAAFSSGASAREAEMRLSNLASGRLPHPVLDVRVECAIACLHRGRDDAVPFLLDIVREGTSAAAPKPSWRRIDWDEERMQSLQDRAAQALSTRVGIECAFRAGAPLAVRESEVVRLARLLQSTLGAK